MYRVNHIPELGVYEHATCENICLLMNSGAFMSDGIDVWYCYGIQSSEDIMYGYSVLTVEDLKELTEIAGMKDMCYGLEITGEEISGDFGEICNLIKELIDCNGWELNFIPEDSYEPVEEPAGGLEVCAKPSSAKCQTLSPEVLNHSVFLISDKLLFMLIDYHNTKIVSIGKEPVPYSYVKDMSKYLTLAYIGQYNSTLYSMKSAEKDYNNVIEKINSVLEGEEHVI